MIRSTEATAVPVTLLSLSDSPLDRTILYFLPTSAGKPWAVVTPDEAELMISHGIALGEAFPEIEDRPDEVQAIIDEGCLAEGLLFGFLNEKNEDEEDFICDDCLAEHAAETAEDRSAQDQATADLLNTGLTIADERQGPRHGGDREE